MKHQEKIDWMIHWAHTNSVRLELAGECGFGRECVGITSEPAGYPEYQWFDDDYNDISGNGDVWTPEDAYHKCECVAVLGRGEQAESQLYDWLKWFSDNNFAVESGDTAPSTYKDIGPLAIIMGKHKYARMVKQEELAR